MIKFFDDYKQTKNFWTLVCSSVIFAIALGSFVNIQTFKETVLIGLLLVCSGIILCVNLYYLNKDLGKTNQQTKVTEGSPK